MRHGKRFNHLGRTAPHRKAMLANMASSLIIHKRLTTTVAKAKALRQYVEPLITRSKVDSTHSRRVVFSYLRDKDSSHVLFNEVADRVAERPGGYTRIIKLGNRLGDNADMCMIELVDFNETYNQEEKQTRGKTRRSRRGSKKKSADSDSAQATASASEEPNKAVKASETEETQSEAETTTDDGAIQEEVVELSGEMVIEDNPETQVEQPEKVQSEEASTEAEDQAETKDEPKAEDDSSSDEDEEKPKE